MGLAASRGGVRVLQSFALSGDLAGADIDGALIGRIPVGGLGGLFGQGEVALVLLDNVLLAAVPTLEKGLGSTMRPAMGTYAMVNLMVVMCGRCVLSVGWLLVLLVVVVVVL